jgi:hypothetical protein
MAKNKIKFQRDLSLPQFLATYGTNEQCRRALFQWCWPHGFVCPECSHSAYCELKSRMLFQLDFFSALFLTRNSMLNQFGSSCTASWLRSRLIAGLLAGSIGLPKIMIRHFCSSE